MFHACARFGYFSKQNQLWMEGAEHFKGKPFEKAEPHVYGIYSIKQRELHKSTNGNGIQTTTKGKSILTGQDSYRVHLCQFYKITLNDIHSIETYFCFFHRKRTRSNYKTKRSSAKYLTESGYHEIERQYKWND